MNPVHAILVLIIRLWAAGVMLSSATALSLWPLEFWDEQTATSSFAIRNYVSTGIWFVIGVSAWILGPRVARATYSGKNVGGINIHVNADNLVAIGCFLIGAFYLAQYVPSSIMNALYIFVDTAHHDSSMTRALGNLQLNPINVEAFLNSSVSIIIASWMAFRPRDFATMFSKLRSAGLAKVETK